MSAIATVRARAILTPQGKRAVEVEVLLESGERGRAPALSRLSMRGREALGRGRGEARFGHVDVEKAVSAVHDVVAPEMRGLDADNQELVDGRLMELAGTLDELTLGAHLTLGVSIAAARAEAAHERTSLLACVGGPEASMLPVPMFTLLNGGKAAGNRIDFQDFMIAPVGAPTFREGARWSVECYRALKSSLESRGLGTDVGHDGGFTPNLRANVEAVEVILGAVSSAGLTPGKDVVLAIDAAATQLFENGTYIFIGTDRRRNSSDEMIALWADWVRQFPIRLIEDGLAGSDWFGWKKLTDRLGGQVSLLGNELFAGDASNVGRAIDAGIANSIAINLNQLGTITEVARRLETARAAGYGAVVGHGLGCETGDDFIADLAVAMSANGMRMGAPCGGERAAKCNQLLRIEEELGSAASYAGALR